VTSQETPDAGALTVSGNGRSGADDWPVLPETVTPALRGFPGGPGLPETSAAGQVPAGNGAAGASPWQRAQRAWQTAGVDWVRQPGWLPEPAWPDAARRHWVAGPQQVKPVGADWDHTEPIPAVRGAGRSRRRRGPGQAGGQPGAARPARAGIGRLADPVIAGPVIAGVAVIALAVAIGTVVLTRPPAPPARTPGLLAGYPPARLADAAFAAGAPAGPRLPPALGALAADGSAVVAAGSQAGPPNRRPLILASADGGASWRTARLQAPGGDVTDGAVPLLLAGGSGSWLAVGTAASWTSATGQAWHQQPGVSVRPGDRILGLARTGSGFLAVGMNTPPSGPATSRGVLWSSPDGITWQRTAAPRAGLRPGNAVTALTQVAARGRTIVITGTAAPAGATAPRGGAPPAPVRAWRSADGGVTWAPVRLPAGHGASALISGVAADRGGFVLVRPGRGPGGRPDAVAYRSADGLGWQFAAVLAGAKRTGLRPTGLSGNSNGAVLAATETGGGGRSASVALVTGTGRTWRRILLLGNAAGGRVAGAVAGPGGSVLAAGSMTAAAGGAAATAAAPARQPFLLLAGPRYAFTGQQALAHAATAGVTVTALATAGGRQVAVGSADGSPVIWTGPAGGRWSADPGGTWAAAGLTLTSITHGSQGWLAAGQAVAHRQAQLVLLSSRDAVTWQPVTGLRRLAASGGQLTQAAAGRDGYVLVGRQIVGGRPAAVAWWSATAGAWSQAAVATPGAAPAGRAAGHAAPPPSQMLAVTAGGPGFVAVGSRGPQPVVWSSADGRSWAAEALPVPAGARSALLSKVAARGQRVVAAGLELTPAGQLPFAALSRDAGRTWQELRLPVPGCRAGAGPAAGPAGPAGLAGTVVTAIAAVGSGFAATGNCGSAGRLDVVVWSSADGRTWTAASPHRPGLSGPGAQQITSLAGSGRFLIGAGYSATLTGDHPTLWRVRVNGAPG
jgi:hypothetical protein